MLGLFIGCWQVDGVGIPAQGRNPFHPTEKRIHEAIKSPYPVLPQHPLPRNGLQGARNREERASLTYGLPHRSHRTASARTDRDSLRPLPFPALSITITSPSPRQTQRAAHDTRRGRPLEQQPTRSPYGHLSDATAARIRGRGESMYSPPVGYVRIGSSP